MRYLIFGTGDYYNRYKKWFEHHEVLALLDNSVQKQHTAIDGLKVLSPEEGIRLNYDRIVILSFYIKQMKQQLISLGVDQSRIYHFYDLHQLFETDRIKRPMRYFLNAKEIVECTKNGVPKVLLLSNDLALGGPSIALFHAAKVLIKQGYAVVYTSMLDGPLRQKLLEYDIPVIVDENLQISTMQETNWVNSFSLLICNTLNFHVFLSERDTTIPVIWWLHDSAFFYHGVKPSVLRLIDRKNMTICSVGSVPAEAIHNFIPDLPIDRLIYGVEDTVSCIDGKKNVLWKQGTKLCFVTIGYIENRKGQDVLIDSIQLLPSEIRDMVEFYLVGPNSSVMAQNIMEQAKEITGIVITGEVNREQINEILSRADMLICPSREDPMPTVCAEAMMHGVPCMVSDVTGTADYIEDGISGFVFPSENAQRLKEKIMWCVVNCENLRKIGENARKVYEKNFSTSVFERKLLQMIENAL